MNDYYKVRIDCDPVSEDITDLVASFLGDIGFESFEPDEDGVTAYINVESGDGVELAREALDDFPISVRFTISQEFVKGENWNEEWEKNYFNPIVIGDQCVIHSTFHKDVPEGKYDIIIDPKMAFGTGHHDTTANMVCHILNSTLEGKSVVDVGTGTGILGILAAMNGAIDVTGIEIDRPAYENALENIKLNQVDMRVIHGDAKALKTLTQKDFLFANINRNIILYDIDKYAEALKEKGVMLLSGFYEQDIPMILEEASKYGLVECTRLVSDKGWAALKLVKN